MVWYVVAIIAIAFIFDFSNGFHDSANSIATIVGTRVLSPLAAVFWAATFNFAALFTGSVAVAKAVGGGMIEQSIVDPHVILGGLLGAICWTARRGGSRCCTSRKCSRRPGSWPECSCVPPTKFRKPSATCANPRW